MNHATHVRSLKINYQRRQANCLGALHDCICFAAGPRFCSFGWRSLVDAAGPRNRDATRKRKSSLATSLRFWLSSTLNVGSRSSSKSEMLERDGVDKLSGEEGIPSSSSIFRSAVVSAVVDTQLLLFMTRSFAFSAIWNRKQKIKSKLSFAVVYFNLLSGAWAAES